MLTVPFFSTWYMIIKHSFINAVLCHDFHGVEFYGLVKQFGQLQALFYGYLSYCLLCYATLGRSSSNLAASVDTVLLNRLEMTKSLWMSRK